MNKTGPGCDSYLILGLKQAGSMLQPMLRRYPLCLGCIPLCLGGISPYLGGIPIKLNDLFSTALTALLNVLKAQVRSHYIPFPKPSKAISNPAPLSFISTTVKWLPEHLGI